MLLMVALLVDIDVVVATHLLAIVGLVDLVALGHTNVVSPCSSCLCVQGKVGKTMHVLCNEFEVYIDAFILPWQYLSVVLKRPLVVTINIVIM